MFNCDIKTESGTALATFTWTLAVGEEEQVIIHQLLQ